MATRKIRSLVIATLLVAIFTSCQRDSANQPAKADAVVRQEQVSNLKLVGTGSCAARGCHGGSLTEDPVPPLLICQDEYSRWLLHDKHASAFDVLVSKPSKRIAKKLDLEREAHEEPRCLACHTNPAAAALDAAPLLKAERLFGVGCESCHGEAAGWLVGHTTRTWSKEDQDAMMAPVCDLALRAAKCAGCHIGAPPDEGILARNMNHDLIAAGHPRLDFEFGAFTANMEPHWSEKRKIRPKTYSAEVWLAGQAAAAEAAAKLLAYRASSEPEQKGLERPWPEFSEYDCFACHHDLKAKSWRQRRGYGKDVPGALPWGNWYFALPEALAQAEHNKPVLEALKRLRGEMRKPGPNKAAAAMHASALVDKLKMWKIAVNDAKLRPERVDTLFRNLAKWGHEGPVPVWDHAAQLYLALLALSECLPDSHKKMEEPLRSLYAELAFPPHYDSPREMEEFPPKYWAVLGYVLEQLKPPR
jgi:hypothetical protein